MQKGSNASIGQSGNRGIEGLSDFLKVKHKNAQARKA